MREKLQTLPLTQLKEIAKSQGMKGISAMKKSDLIDLLCQKAEEGKGEAGTAAAPAQSAAPVPSAAPARQETPVRTEPQSRVDVPICTETPVRTENQNRTEGQTRPYNQYRQNN